MRLEIVSNPVHCNFSVEREMSISPDPIVFLATPKAAYMVGTSFTSKSGQYNLSTETVIACILIALKVEGLLYHFGLSCVY